MDKPQKPYVNPYPHNGHVDIVQPNTGQHEHIPVKNPAAAEVIKHAYLNQGK
jgi:hypothetical protein